MHVKVALGSFGTNSVPVIGGSIFAESRLFSWWHSSPVVDVNHVAVRDECNSLDVTQNVWVTCSE